jgi:response regulator RpfG family c-di-GMP phosphodiesterase
MATILRYWEKINNKTTTPIFALTAHADNKMKENCISAGIDQVFMKPLDEALFQMILAYFKKYKEHMRLKQKF